MSPYRSLLETADLLGRYRYVELECFAILGARASVAEDEVATVDLAGAARAHAWRAVELEGRLPVSVGLPGVLEATRSPGPDLDDALGALADESDDAALLGALVGVLYPAMATAYDSHLATLHELSDPPVERALRRVASDLAATQAALDRWRAVPEAALGDVVRSRISAAGGPFGPNR